MRHYTQYNRILTFDVFTEHTVNIFFGDVVITGNVLVNQVRIAKEGFVISHC